VRQTDEPVGHPILSGNNRNAFQIHEYSSPFRVCHVVVGEWEGQIPGQRGVGRDLGLKQRIQYAHKFYSRRYVAQHRFSLPPQEYERQILTSISWYMCRGAVFGFLYQIHNAGRRYGLDRCLSQMPCLLSDQRNRSGSLPAEWPPHTIGSSDIGTPTNLFFTNGRIWNPRGRPKQGGPLSEGNERQTHYAILWFLVSMSSQVVNHPRTL
jgi:hypothetical protein